MKARDFVSCWRREKDDLVASFTSEDGTSIVATRLRALGLTPGQQAAMTGVLDAALTDTFYTLLLGLTGEASIGGVQSMYTLLKSWRNLSSSRWGGG